VATISRLKLAPATDAFISTLKAWFAALAQKAFTEQQFYNHLEQKI
jgi:hypothetical protein